MNLGLKDKRALVTGASRGLGYAAASTLAKEGCRVAINSRDEARVQAAAQAIQTENGTQVFGLAGDVSDAQTAEKLVHAAVESLGGLDILIVNAGGPPAGSFEALDDSAWQNAVETSFLAHVRLVRAALPSLKRSSAASVLAVASFTVKEPLENLALSNSVRAATVGLIKSLALELGRAGIRFNSILPGWTETERVQNLMNFRAQSNTTTIEEETAKLTANIPLGRLGRPQEFGNAAAFLVSPAASYIHGIVLAVDGGWLKGTF